MKALSSKHRQFCIEYTSTHMGNGTKAYMAVYPKASYYNARTSASRLLKKPHIQAYIEELLSASIYTRLIGKAHLSDIIEASEDPKLKLSALKLLFDNTKEEPPAKTSGRISWLKKYTKALGSSHKEPNTPPEHNNPQS